VIPGPRVYPSGALISQTAGHGDFAPAYAEPHTLGGPVSRLEQIGAFVIANGIPEVMAAVRTQLKRGASLLDVMTHEGMLDTAEHPGMLLIVKSMRGPELNFHCFAPWRHARDALFDLRTDPTVPTPVEDAIFAASLEVPWGVLGLMSSDNGPWVWPRQRHQPFLHAALAFWDELDAVGPRYYWAVQGERVWNIARNLHYVLANMGVPNDVLRAPLPPEGPRTLLRYARAQA
jgi:hypothetical protein